MQVSAKTHYACKALLELTLHWPNLEPLPINTISERQKIPLKFLTQILILLKQLGYVQSIRGQKGGYLLTIKPADIKLSNVFSSLENSEIKNADNIEQKHVMNDIWEEINMVVRKKMDEISFEKIANKQRSANQTMTFEI